MKAIVYSAYFGSKEPLNDSCFGRWTNLDRVILTDNPDLEVGYADVVYDPPGAYDLARASRRGKLQPHKYFPDHDWSLYIDNNASLRVDPLALIEKVSAPRRFRKPSAGFHCFRHQSRKCIYDEALKCIELGKDDPEIIQSQMARFKADGFPRRAGLIVGTFLIRAHNRPPLTELGEHWFDLVAKGSRRDQLAFNYVAWKMGFKPDYLPANPVRTNLMQWPVYTEDLRQQDFAPAPAPH